MLNQYDELIQRVGANAVIEQGVALLTPNRIARMQSVLNQRISHLAVAVESPCDIHNALAIARSCDAFGVSQFSLIAPEGDLSNAKSLTSGTLHWLDYQLFPTLNDYLPHASGRTLVGTSPHANSTLADVPLEQPVTLLFGNEQRGLTEEAMQAMDLLVKIPTVGMVESLNLSVSAAICLHHLRDRIDKQSIAAGYLDAEYDFQFARFILQSIKPSVIDNLF